MQERLRWVDNKAIHNGLTTKQHAIAHRIPIRKGNFDFKSIISN